MASSSTNCQPLKQARESAPLEKLPQELFDLICSKLTQQDATMLARVSKTVHIMVQDHLYRHAVVTSFASLALLMRTMDDSAKYGKHGRVVSKDIKDLTIIVNMAKPQGDIGTVVVLCRILDNVIRYCPQVRITLQVLNANCQRQPISSFAGAVFSRVKLLVLHTGFEKPPQEMDSAHHHSSYEQLIRHARHRMMARDDRNNQNKTCRPNREFWTSLFNGSFPDMEEVIIAHVGPRSTGSAFSSPVKFSADDLNGLGKLTRLSIEGAPELNDSVLMSALSKAPSLKKLSLKNIAGLTYKVLSDLVSFALPNLDIFTLHVSDENPSAYDSMRRVENFDPSLPKDHDDRNTYHLCPLIRVYGKNIRHLDLYLPYLCREIFLSPSEEKELVEAGINIKIGDENGAKGLEALDKSGIRSALASFRKRMELKDSEAAIISEIAAARKNGRQLDWSIAEYAEERKKRERRTTIQKQGWHRTIRTAVGLCRSDEAWEELGCLAELDEPGLIWKLGHNPLNEAGTYVGGEMGIETTYDELFGTDSRPRRPIDDGHDHNDNY